MALAFLTVGFVLLGQPLHLQGGSGYVPIVEHQGDDPAPTPVPPSFPIPNTTPIPNALPQVNANANTSDTYTYDLAIGSQGDFPQTSANYTLTIAVVTKKVNGVVTETRPLNANEIVKGKFLDTSIRVGATDPSYGNVRHGKVGTLKFTDMAGTAVQLTLKREFPIDPMNNTYKIDFLVP